MFKLATGFLGISFSDYYEATPRELLLMFEGYSESRKQIIEMQEIATRIAIINAMGKKNHKVFDDEKEVVKKVDVEKKKQDLDYLRDTFV